MSLGADVVNVIIGVVGSLISLWLLFSIKSPSRGQVDLSGRVGREGGKGIGGRAERSEREVLVEDVLGVVGGLQLAEPGEGAAGKRVMQALRALVRLEAEVEAVQVVAQLVPVGVETARRPRPPRRR